MSAAIRITYCGETVIMSWDGSQASAPIVVDGQPTGRQTADARHRTAEAVRIAAAHVWPDQDWSDGGEAWSDLAYSPGYVIRAGYGEGHDSSTPEVLGDAYGVVYASRDDAEAVCEDLQDTIADYDLDPTTVYSVEVAP